MTVIVHACCLHTRSALLLGCGLLLAFYAFPALAEPTRPMLSPVDGDPFPATLVSIDSKWNCTFKSEGKDRVLAARDIALWGNCHDAKQTPRILLADGSVLVARRLELDDDSLQVSLSLDSGLDYAFEPVTIALGSIRGIIFDSPFHPIDRDRLTRRIMAATGDDDRLVLPNGDLVRGILTQLKKAPREKLKTKIEVDGKTVSFGGPDKPDSRIASVVFDPALIEQPNLSGFRMIVGLADGSRLVVKKINPGNGDVAFTLVDGTVLKSKNLTIWKRIVYLQPLGGRAVYLSDLPGSYKHVPYLGLKREYTKDGNTLGGALRSEGHLIPKGLGMFPTSRLAWNIDNSYKSFVATVGLDDATEKGGSVIFRVFVLDRQGQWKLKYKSPVLRGSDKPQPVAISLDGASQIALIVEQADRGDQHDHGCWFNARLTREKQ